MGRTTAGKTSGAALGLWASFPTGVAAQETGCVDAGLTLAGVVVEPGLGTPLRPVWCSRRSPPPGTDGRAVSARDKRHPRVRQTYT